MKLFTIGLLLGGDIKYVMAIMASTLGNACREWARLTGHLDGNWDDSKCSYNKGPVIETKEKALARKGNPTPFGY